MADNKNIKGQTMAVTLIILIVISIVALGVTYIVSQTTIARNRKSNTDINSVRLGNACYDVINDINEYYLANSTLVGYENSDVKVSIIDSDSLSFSLKKDFYSKTMFIEVKYSASGYKILRWEEV